MARIHMPLMETAISGFGVAQHFFQDRQAETPRWGVKRLGKPCLPGEWKTRMNPGTVSRVSSCNRIHQFTRLRAVHGHRRSIPLQRC